MEEKGKITVQFNERGELVYVDLDGRRLTENEYTNDLHNNPPPGIFKGFTDMGKIYTYEQNPSGSLRRCVKRRCKLY